MAQEQRIADERAMVIVEQRAGAVGPAFAVGPRFYESRARWLECKEHWLRMKTELSGWTNTAKAYRTDWDEFFRFLSDRPEPLDLWQVDGMVAQAWIESLAVRVRDTTINRKIAAMSSFYTHASMMFTVEAAEVGRRVPLWPSGFGNPFKQVQRVKVHDKSNRREWPTPAEMYKIFDRMMPLDSAKDWQDMTILMGVYLTLRRSSEWLNLRWRTCTSRMT